MINTTAREVVFNADGLVLSMRVRDALKITVQQHLLVAGLQKVRLDSVTTKKNIRAAFAKFVEGRVLREPNRLFDADYVDLAFEAYEAKHGYIDKAIFNALMSADEQGEYSYKRSYAGAIKPVLGVFLIALHSSGAITLPGTFNWPSLRTTRNEGAKRVEIGKFVASEILSFVRKLDSRHSMDPHPAFEVIGGDSKRRAWFLTYATKLLLATGWHRPEDVNTEDLVKIKAAEKKINGDENGNNSIPFAYSALLDVLNRAFPGRVKITSEDWLSENRKSNVIRLREVAKAPASRRYLFNEGPRSDNALLDEVLNFRSAWGHPKHIRYLVRIPGLDVDIKALSKLWVDLEDLYVSKVLRESYKHFYNAVGWWNLYLFYYLPYWFDRNSRTNLTFPSTPSLLGKATYVSRLLPLTENLPITFMEYMNAQAEKSKWDGNFYYSTLKQLQSFFAFLERYAEEIPGCEGFAQPLSPHDFPRSSRSKNTNKKPVPRRFFGVLLDYYEALIAHHTAVLGGIVSGSISEDDVRFLLRNKNIIDTFATSAIVGFIPVLFTAQKTIALQFIPNLLDMRRRAVKGGRELVLPHPHALYQNLVSLHTGIRHNHIQWLDRDRFDELVREGDVEFANLYVNTDKQKRSAWTPYVSFRVIELLRAQRRWCELVESASFLEMQYYNNNKNTKWPKLRPLFAYTADGRPHSDDVYMDAWKAVLCGLQGMMPQLAEYGPALKLLQLLPPGFSPKDFDLEKNLAEFGATFTKIGESCPLRVHTASTPHSSRAAVVSQYITFLPIEFIGKYVTGQKPGTVVYYVRFEEEELELQQVEQAARMREAALKQIVEPILKNGEASPAFIHADHVNSNLARSMKIDFEETIAVYGGMSISFREETRNGLDVLRETKCSSIAFNKTEVCGFGNDCPADIVKELKGLRRCSLCPYAVRFVDHLPAVSAKKRQVADAIDGIENLLGMDATTLNARYSSAELDILESDRSRLCEDLSGWILSEEILEVMRQRISAGLETRSCTVQRPAILEQNLKRVTIPASDVDYLLSRLGECIAFPSLQSPQILARLDLLRRELLARAGRVGEAFSKEAIDPAAECAGMLKAIIESHGLTVAQISAFLDSEAHLHTLPSTNLRLLSSEDLA